MVERNIFRTVLNHWNPFSTHAHIHVTRGKKKTPLLDCCDPTSAKTENKSNKSKMRIKFEAAKKNIPLTFINYHLLLVIYKVFKSYYIYLSLCKQFIWTMD